MAPRRDPPAPDDERTRSPGEIIATPADPPGPATPPRLQLPDPQTSALIGTFVLLLLASLYFARGFVLPVVVAVVLSLLLSPLVRGLARLRIPQGLGALLVLLGFVVLVGLGAYRLSGPAARWMDEAPRNLERVEDRLRNLREPVRKVTEATQKVEELASMGGEDGVEPVRVAQPHLSSALFTGTRKFVAQATVTIILLYFLLASGDIFLRKLVLVLPRFRDKRKAVEVTRQIQGHVGRYLLVVSLINAGLAGTVGLALMLLGMPTPFLWGVLAGVLNFVPFLGAILTFATVAVVALLSFESTVHALAVPLVYGAINFTEGSFVTPLILGRQLLMNPVAIFVSLMFWSWLWGIPGALLAVPLLAILKIVSDHLEPLRPVGEFLGR